MRNISSSTYRSPTATLARPMPASVSVRSSARLAITVVTTVPPLSCPSRREMPPADGQRVVTVPDLARLVHRDEPVPVAVEGEPEVGPRAQHLLLQPLRMHRPHAAVDVLAVRARVQHPHVGAQATEDLGGHPVGRAVRAVEHDAHVTEIVRAGRARVRDVIGLGRLVDDEPADIHAGGPRRGVGAVQPPLDLRLPRRPGTSSPPRRRS